MLLGVGVLDLHELRLAGDEFVLWGEKTVRRR